MQAMKIQSRKAAERQDVLWLFHTEMGADLSPQIPLSLCPTQGQNSPYFGAPAKQPHPKKTSRAQLSTCTSITEKREIFLKDFRLFSEQKHQNDMRHQKLDSKKKPISWWQLYRPTTASSSWGGLAASPLLSAASKGRKSEVWRGYSANRNRDLLQSRRDTKKNPV